MTKRTLKDGMILITMWECPDCGEREGFKFTREECGCKIQEEIPVGEGYLLIGEDY